MAKVTFLGLGVMGYPMARHIAKAGHDVTVYNRTTVKAEKWAKEFGGKFAKTPKEASKDSDFIFCCVGNDNDLKEVTLGSEGAFHSIKKGSVFIDNTTASAKIARELFKAAKEKGFGFLDAPVSGGQAGAENGQLTVMIGGEDKDFEKAQDIIKCYSKKMKVLGPAGSGQLAKMVNQICIVGLVQGLSEGIRFGQNAGLNMEDVIEVISKGAAQSWQMENRYKTMIQDKFDFGFAIDWMRKDLGIAMEEAKNNGSDLPITKIIDGYYADVQKNGGNRFDTSSLITRLKKNKLLRVIKDIPDYYNNINLILDEIWILLQRGVVDRNEEFRLPVVIANSQEGADGRIVVLRGAFKDKNILRFHTDYRSPKIDYLKKNNKIYFVFYSKKRKIQVRAEGIATIHKDNEITKQAWTKTQMISRKCYLSPQAPGDLINRSASDLSKDIGSNVPTFEQSEIGYKNFCVVESKIKIFEWLYLASQGHRRAKFLLDENKSSWLVP